MTARLGSGWAHRLLSCRGRWAACRAAPGRRRGACCATGFGGDKSSLSDALTKSLSDVSKTSGRQAQTRNFVMAPGDDESSWRAMDQAVNRYPGERSFKAVGEGGDQFVRAMASAVEGVVGPLDAARQVHSRPSSKGKYISVTIGPVTVQSGDQVIRVFNALRADERLRWYM